MNCLVCGRHTQKADLYRGPYCSDFHFEKIVEDERRLFAELLAEPAGLMPKVFGVEDLERLALKIALRISQAIPPDNLPEGDALLPASQISLVVKEKMFLHVPAGYLSCLPLQGAARLCVGQTYQLRTKIPMEVVRAALKAAGYLRFC
jgi:hypothetical protein